MSIPALQAPYVLAAARAAQAPGLRLGRLLWPIAALLAPVACAAPAQPPVVTKPNAATAAVLQVTQIVWERGCFGCATGTVLVLQRDGRASLTATGNARHGTADRVSSGTVAPAVFDALARRATQDGFFDLPEIIDNPDQRDGAWSTLRITRNGNDKQVFLRKGVAAPALISLQAAIEAAQARIAFSPRP